MRPLFFFFQYLDTTKAPWGGMKVKQAFPVPRSRGFTKIAVARKAKSAWKANAKAALQWLHPE